MNYIDKVEKINSLIKEVGEYKEKNPKYKVGYKMEVGSILNAYREGDISFDKTKEELLLVEHSIDTNNMKYIDKVTVYNNDKKAVQCPVCNGTGQVNRVQQTDCVTERWGECNGCNGYGWVVI